MSLQHNGSVFTWGWGLTEGGFVIFDPIRMFFAYVGPSFTANYIIVNLQGERYKLAFRLWGWRVEC